MKSEVCPKRFQILGKALCSGRLDRMRVIPALCSSNFTLMSCLIAENNFILEKRKMALERGTEAMKDPQWETLWVWHYQLEKEPL